MLCTCVGTPAGFLCSTSSSTFETGYFEQRTLTCTMICQEGQYYVHPHSITTTTEIKSSLSELRVEVLFIPSDGYRHNVLVYSGRTILEYKNDLLIQS